MPGVMPKKKHSRRRVKGRWAHNALTATDVVDCPQCQNPKLPHRACKECGFYNGREVIAVDNNSATQ
ncbi:MAG: 50S ribosomal protein L32 [Chloroflexota bacterium]|nr:50S ribosomal protein L32 [Chloroflexota bacterium]